jgi:hypothetical protein
MHKSHENNYTWLISSSESQSVPMLPVPGLGWNGLKNGKLKIPSKIQEQKMPNSPYALPSSNLFILPSIFICFKMELESRNTANFHIPKYSLL